MCAQNCLSIYTNNLLANIFFSIKNGNYGDKNLISGKIVKKKIVENLTCQQFFFFPISK